MSVAQLTCLALDRCRPPFPACDRAYKHPDLAHPQCLDRTNAVEDSLSRFALEDFLRNTQPSWLGVTESAALWSSHRMLFADVCLRPPAGRERSLTLISFAQER